MHIFWRRLKNIIYDRYYKITDKENNVQYYYLNGTHW